MVDAGGEYFIFWLSRAQENVFLDAFSKNFVFVSQMFFVQQKSGWAIVHPPPLRLRGPCLNRLHWKMIEIDKLW